MAFSGPTGGMLSDINVTPLVDVMLVLLIIFMVTATFIKTAGMHIQLPSSSATRAGGQAKRELVVGNLSIDGARGKVTLDNSPLSLSPTEFELLYALAENAGHPVNQETLLRRVWGEDFSGHTNVVDVSVHRLRRKLEKVSTREHILTIRGMGYMLTDSSASPLAKG